MPLPALLATAPAILGTAQGVGQLISGAVKKRQANDMQIPLTDPNQAAMLDEINRRRAALQSGKSTEFQLQKDLLGRGQAQTQANVLRAGGDGGSVMAGLAMAQRTGGDLMNKAAADLSQKESYYTTLANQMTDKLAQRKLELQMWEKLQKMRESAEATQAGWQNIAAGATLLTPKLGTMGTGTTGSSTASVIGTANKPAGTLPSLNMLRTYGALIPSNRTLGGSGDGVPYATPSIVSTGNF